MTTGGQVMWLQKKPRSSALQHCAWKLVWGDCAVFVFAKYSAAHCGETFFHFVLMCAKNIVPEVLWFFRCISHATDLVYFYGSNKWVLSFSLYLLKLWFVCFLHNTVFSIWIWPICVYMSADNRTSNANSFSHMKQPEMIAELMFTW